MSDNTEIKSVKSFLAHINTKAELTRYLSRKTLEHYEGQDKQVLVMHHTIMEANCPLSEILSMPEMDTGRHDLEEGDQLVILNAYDVMHKDPQVQLDIFSIDTDVFVLLTSLFPSIPTSTTLIRRGSERVSIQDSYKKLGSKRAEALIGWYAFKGTDNTGSFAGKGVAAHFKAFLQADDDILNAFSYFGNEPTIPGWINVQMERYTCLLYKIGDLCADKVHELRWMLFAQKSKEGQQLPPTIGTLIPHIARAYYMALVWKSSGQPCPHIPLATNYAWELVDGRLKAVYCTNPPAPEALLELRRCHCKTGCTRKSCGCLKNNLKCTDMCGCGDACQNVYHDTPLDMDDYEPDFTS